MGNKSSILGVIKPRIFRFNFSIDDYKFEFHVHEIDKATAEVHLQQMVNLYIKGYARVARAKLEAGLESKNADEIIRIADVLSRYDFSGIEVAVEENGKSYYGRKFSDKSALFSVCGHNGLELDEFDLKVNDFNTYGARALSVDTNYLRSLMSKIDCFNRDFHGLLPDPVYFFPRPLHLNPENKIPVYDPIKLKELKKKLVLDYKMAEIPQDVFEYGTPYSKKIIESFEFIRANNDLIVKKKDLFKITPLMVSAARNGIGLSISRMLKESLESIKIMLRDRSIDINQQDIFGRTALMHVVLRLYFDGDIPGKEAVTKLLLEHGADPFVTDVLGKSALDYFVEYCGEYHPAYRLLLEKSNALAYEPAVQTCSPIPIGFFTTPHQEQEFLSMHRNDNAASRRKYDERYGIVPYSVR